MATDAVERLYKLSVEGGQAITEMKRVAKASEDSAKHIKDFQKQFKDMRNTVFAGLTVAAVVTGFKNIVTAMSDIVDESAKLGVTTTELQELRFAAQQSGVSAASLSTGIKKLQIGMQELNDPTNEQGRLLKQLGVTTGDTVTKAFHKIADAYKLAGNESAKVAVITKALGKSANELIPMLAGGSEELRKFNKEAADLGLIIDDKTLAMFDAVGDNMDKMGASLQAVGVRIAGEFLPAFMAISEAILKASKETTIFTGLGSALGNIALFLAKTFIAFWTVLRQVGTALGGIAAAIVTFFAETGSISERAAKSGKVLSDTFRDVGKMGDEADATFENMDAAAKKFANEGIPAIKKSQDKFKTSTQDNSKEIEKQAKLLADLQFEYQTLLIDMNETEKLQLKLTLGLVKYNTEQKALAQNIAALKDQEKQTKILQDLQFEYEVLLVDMNEMEKLNLKLAQGTLVYNDAQLEVARALARRKDLDKEIKEATEKKIEVDKRAVDAQNKLAEAAKTQEDSWHDLERSLDPVMAAEEDHRLAVEQLNAAYGTKLVPTTERYIELLGKIDKKFEPKKTVDALSILADNFEAFFKNLESGTERASELFKRMVQSIIAQLLKLLAQQLILKAFGINIFPAAKAAHGMVFDQTGIVRFASGGVLSSPIMFPIAGGRAGVAGEAGAEGVFPLARTSSGDLGVKGTTANVQVNVVNNTSSEVQVKASDDGQRIDILIERTKRAIANDVRTGGNMFSSAIESTYALGRARG